MLHSHTSKEAQELILPLLDQIKDRASQIHACTNLSAAFLHAHPGPQLQAYQEVAMHAGALSIFVDLVTNDSNSDRIRCMGLALLRFLSFKSEKIVRQILENLTLFQCLRDHLRSLPPTTGTLLSLSLVQTLASHFSTHSILLPLIPEVMLIMQYTSPTPEYKSLRSCAVRMLGNFTYNPDSHPVLLEAGVLESLAEVMDGDPDLWPVSAAVGVACLSQGHHPLLSQPLAPRIAQPLMGALLASLKDQDFPHGSGGYPTDWKLMTGVAYMSKNQELLQCLRTYNITTHITLALKKHADNRNVEETKVLARLSLEVLWRLSS
eukprot:c20921_g1_i1.p1 GENE.c20921_g1_i1~~c20921_g1_i1.p1  ORF type:complete len:321 (-),score=57.34 c20921_g1_i1:214-1176(-)